MTGNWYNPNQMLLSQPQDESQAQKEVFPNILYISQQNPNLIHKV